MKASEAAQLIKTQFGHAVIRDEEFLDEFTLTLHKGSLREVLLFLKNPEGPGFCVLSDLTGVDYLQPDKHTKVVYWLQNPDDYARIRLIVEVKRDERNPSVCDLWPGADWYERELFDLFGVYFEGHPDLKRILMPDDWLGHPLRRDYALTEEPVQFKHGVQPKVPSEIIPKVKDYKKVPGNLNY